MKVLKNILLGILKAFEVVLITFVFILLACISVIFLLERGPSETAKNVFVKSVTETAAMGFVAEFFLTEEEVDEIVESAQMQEVEEGTTNNTDLIDTSEVSDEIEIIEISGSTYKGYLMIIHDPSRVFLGTVPEFGETSGLTVLDMIEYYEETYGVTIAGGVNAGDFVDMGSYSYTAQPLGLIRSSIGSYAGTTYTYTTMSTYHICGFTQDNVLVMGNLTKDEIEEMDLRDCVYTVHTTGPFLIMDGESLIDEVPDSATYGGGKNPRTAIGQREDGSILLLVIDGRQANSLGATFKDLCYIMQEYGAVNACAMDGGTSSQMIYDYEIINNPYSPSGPRKCPTAWLVLGE